MNGRRKIKIARVVVVGLVVFMGVNFLVFWSHLRAIQTVPVQLPKAATQPRNDSPAELQILVLNSTTCSLDGESVEFGAVKDRILKAKAEGRTAVSIKLAKGAPIEAIVTVLDLVRQSGIERVSVDAR